MRVLIFSFLILHIGLVNAQRSVLIVKEDSSNLAIFVTDFVSNNFEGGVVYHLPKNNTDSLLFQITYHPPSDFGSIEFKHQPSNKIVFKGGIVWDGAGEMEIPTILLKPSEFSICNKLVKRPKKYQHFDYCEDLKSYILQPKVMARELSTFYHAEKYAKEFEELNSLEKFIDRTWKSINNIKVVNDFVQKKCKVGFYLYTPAVGMFNPREAKWVTFLYVN